MTNNNTYSFIKFCIITYTKNNLKHACEAFNELYTELVAAQEKTTLNTDCFLLFPLNWYMANVHTLLILLLLIRLFSCIRLNSYIFKQKDRNVTYFAYTPQTSRGYGTLKKINKIVYKYLID